MRTDVEEIMILLHDIRVFKLYRINQKENIL